MRREKKRFRAVREKRLLSAILLLWQSLFTCFFWSVLNVWVMMCIYVSSGIFSLICVYIFIVPFFRLYLFVCLFCFSFLNSQRFSWKTMFFMNSRLSSFYNNNTKKNKRKTTTSSTTGTGTKRTPLLIPYLKLEGKFWIQEMLFRIITLMSPFNVV